MNKSSNTKHGFTSMTVIIGNKNLCHTGQLCTTVGLIGKLYIGSVHVQYYTLFHIYVEHVLIVLPKGSKQQRQNSM